MLQVLINNPLLLLFVVAAIGYPLGQLKVHGSCLGVAAVLFVGLAVGSIHPDLKLPEIVYILGLGLFVYTIGLSSGPAFVASLRREGLRNNLLVIGMLFFASGLAVTAHRLLHLKASLTAGMFAGCLTNTPALASALETIKHTAPAQALELMLAEPVVATPSPIRLGLSASSLPSPLSSVSGISTTLPKQKDCIHSAPAASLS